jgi:hypothetical protein
MQFFKVLIAAALVAVTSAKVVFTNLAFDGITVGTPFNITWIGNTGNVALKLKTGDSTAQVFVNDIASKFLHLKPSGLDANVFVRS